MIPATGESTAHEASHYVVGTDKCSWHPSLGGLAPWDLGLAELPLSGPGLARPGWVARPGTARVLDDALAGWTRRGGGSETIRPRYRRQSCRCRLEQPAWMDPSTGWDEMESVLDLGAVHRRRLLGFHIGMKKETKLNKLPFGSPPPPHRGLASSDFLSPPILLFVLSLPKPAPA